jgi:hypothetical protein
MTPFLLRGSICGVLAAMLAACSSAPTTVDVRDRSVFIPSARVSVPLSSQQEAPSAPQNGHALELGYTQAKGSGSQSLSAGQSPIVFGGQTFNAPQTLQYQFDYRHSELQYRWRRFFGSRPIGIEVLGGLVHSRLNLSASAPGRSASERFSSNGLTAGVGGIWKFRPTTSLQVRFSAFAASETAGHRTELFVAQALGRNAAIRGGYTFWRLRTEPAFDSEVTADFSGPAVSLDVMF